VGHVLGLGGRREMIGSSKTFGDLKTRPGLLKITSILYNKIFSVFD
jgi:hypothetical protein